MYKLLACNTFFVQFFSSLNYLRVILQTLHSKCLLLSIIYLDNNVNYNCSLVKLQACMIETSGTNNNLATCQELPTNMRTTIIT